MIDRIAAVCARDYRTAVRVYAYALDPGIQLLVDEQPHPSSPNVRGVKDELARQLALNTEVPGVGHRIDQVRINCLNAGLRIRRASRRQRTDTGFCKATAPGGGSERADREHIRGRSGVVVENVVKEY